MKFTCLQENLSHGLAIVTKAVPTKSSLPILSNVLITAEDGRIKLSATNLETAITTFVGASTERPGSITVPAKLLRDFISNLSPSTITANLTDEILQIVSEKTKSKFNGVSAEDYPQLPVFSKEVPFIEIDPKVFANAISYVAFAAATDESRPVFTGVYISYESGLLTIAASDGFRLSEKVIEVKGEATNFTTIIPAKTLIEIARLFSSAQEPIKMTLNTTENLALFLCEDTLIASRILDGQYPDYKRIVPTASVLTAEFLTQELLEAVRLTNVFNKENNNAIKIKFDISGNIGVAASTQEVGEHQSQINGHVDGENLEIAFNSKYLLDLLNNVKTERMTLTTNGKINPCLIKPVEEGTFIHIIMPMQIQ